MTPTRLALIGMLAAQPCSAATAARAAEAHGTLRYRNVNKTVHHAYLVAGPDAIESSKHVRRLVFSTDHIGAQLGSCATMSCTDGKVTDGMSVDMDGGPRLNYWLALKAGMVQFSGTEKPEALKLTTNQPGRLAGTLRFDGTPQGGPIVDIQFDVPMLKEFATAR